MKILLDLAKADHGRATIGGTRYREIPDPARRVGVVLGRTDQMLEMVGLTHAADRHVGGYSLGMRQRLGLAAALLGDPPVLVLDEPGNGLDPQGIRWLRDLLRERAAAGGTVFLSSHLLAEVEHLADEVVVVSHGKLVATGALATLQNGGTSVRTPEPARLTQVLLTSAGATVHTGNDGDLVVRGVEIAEIDDRARAAGIALHELTTRAGSLEELFLTLTSNDNTLVNGADTTDTTRTERQELLR